MCNGPKLLIQKLEWRVPELWIKLYDDVKSNLFLLLAVKFKAKISRVVMDRPTV